MRSILQILAAVFSAAALFYQRWVKREKSRKQHEIDKAIATHDVKKINEFIADLEQSPPK